MISKEIQEYYLYYNPKTQNSVITTSPVSTGELQYVLKFYGISPEFRPIPYGTELFCIKFDTDSPDISSFTEFYDPFNQDENCLKLRVWNDAAPFTTPLYIYKTSKDTPESKPGIFCSTVAQNSPGLESLIFSPIHVLTKGSFPRIIPPERSSGSYGTGTSDLSRSAPNGASETSGFTGEIKFSDYNQGDRCLPDPKGTELKVCLENLKYEPGIQPSILQKLGSSRTIVNKSLILILFIVLIFIILILLI